MFTGIIETTAGILENRDGKLVLERPASFDDLVRGASIAVAGTCLTVTDFDGRSMTFAVVPETLRHTTLGALATGQRVNLERAMRADGRFDGHVVQGHIEDMGTVDGLDRGENGDVRLSVRVPEALSAFIVAKGSITLDGVSLTVAALEGDRVTVALIPETLERTTLGGLTPGARVNVETDILARYAAHRS